jgi:3-hydroxyisobutyrate dehydrogenase
MTMEVKPGTTKIGWIGTGIMGASMCGHLLTGGYEAIVYNRTRAKAEPLIGRGARWADSPAAVTREADVVFTIVGFPADVREVYFGANGILEAGRPGMIVVDMTTTEPSLAAEIAAAASQKGISAIDAPVSGGDIGARNAALSIMVGGDAAAVETIMPLFALMGKNIRHMGAPGAGQHTKMCNQIALSGIMTGVAQALIYGHQAGLNLDDLIAAIGKGAAGCWIMDNLAPKMAVHDFRPGFYVEHYLKDLSIAARECTRMGISLPGLDAAITHYKRVTELGHGRSAYHALLLALEEVAGTDISAR